MSGALLEAFRHNSWASKELMAFCRAFSPDQLAASATGSYGGVLVTFNHLVLSEGGYLRRLAGSAPEWVSSREDAFDLERLAQRVEELERLWERFLSEPVDAEKVFVVDDGALEVRAGVIVAQVIHHGSAHREQVCAILTGLGLEPPDIQPWAYAEATGRMWARISG